MQGIPTSLNFVSCSVIKPSSNALSRYGTAQELHLLFQVFFTVGALLSLSSPHIKQTTVFINSLPWSERYLFTNAKYKDVVYINVSQLNAHLHLTPDGIVEEAEDVENYTKHKFKDDELKGMHIKDVVKLFKEKGIYLPYKNDLEKTIKEVDNWNYQKEEMLNCVMYRLIERGGNRVGPRRAFLFAKEFSRNIDIPMMYGVDYSDPGLLNFINEYINAGGSKDLLCCSGYLSRSNKFEKLEISSIAEIHDRLTKEQNIIDERIKRLKLRK